MAAELGEPSEICRTQEIRRHLESCPECRRYREMLQTDDKLLHALAENLRPEISRVEDRVVELLQRDSVQRGKIRGLRARDLCTVAAAAVILCVVGLTLVRFLGLTTVASVGLARTFEAIQGRAWVHAMESEAGKVTAETWQRSDGCIVAIKSPEGGIRYMNFADRVEYEYNPNSNKVTVSLLVSRYLPVCGETPIEMVANILKSAEKAGAKVSSEGAPEHQANREIIRLDYPSGSPVASTTLVRDTATSLLLHMEVTRHRGGKETVEQIALDYPDPGPEDIYALGAPVDATFHDTRPGESVMAMVDRIRERSDFGLGDHQAVLLESEIQDDATYLPLYVSVVRQKGQLKRWDYCDAFSFQGLALPYPGEAGRWPNLTIPQVLDIVASGAMKPSRQMLFDGSHTVMRQVDRGKAEIRESKGDEFKASWGRFFTCYLPSLVWPDLYYELLQGASAHSRPEVVELPADPNRSGLVGLRIDRFGETREYWFDPARDYILMEEVQIQQCVSTRREHVRELGQTSGGVWYPRVIETESTSLGPDGVPDRTQRREMRILFEENPAIDDAFFDPKTLTGTSPQSDHL
ncbi:MAG: anti-sigma factor family protein [Solirubrobacterales bacterium]